MGRPAKYPWRHMRVGDSILIPGRRTSLKGCVAHLRPQLRFRFKQLVVAGEPTVRVWRVA